MRRRGLAFAVALAAAVAAVGMRVVGRERRPPRPAEASGADAGDARAAALRPEPLGPAGGAPGTAPESREPPTPAVRDAETVEGRVVGDPSGAAVTGARVRAWADDEAPCGTGVTDASGRFSVGGGPATAKCFVVVDADGYATRLERLEPGAPRRGLALRVQEGGVLEGIVRDADGRPAADRDVTVVDEGEPVPPRQRGRGGLGRGGELGAEKARVRRARTDSEGRYEIRGVPLGVPHEAVVIVADRLEARSGTATFERPSDRLRRDVRFPRPGSLRVRFAGVASGDEAREQITVLGGAFWFTAEPEERDAGGAWLLEGLAPGAYEVQAFRRGRTPETRNITIREGERVEIEIPPPKGVALEGVVVDGAGEPVAEAHVMWDALHGAFTDTSENGRFRFEGVVDREGRLVVDPGWGEHGDLARTAVKVVVLEAGTVRVVLPKAPLVLGRIVGLTVGANVTNDVFSRTVTWGGGLNLQAEGRFEIAMPEADTSTILVLRVDGAPLLVLDLLPLKAGEKRDLGDLRLPTGGLLIGVVRDEGGRPFAGAKVIVAEKWSDQTTLTDAAGEFRFERMPDRRTEIRVDAPGFPVHIVVLPPPIEGTKPEVRLGKGGLLDVRVVDEAGVAVPNAPITFIPGGEYPYDVDFDKTRRRAEADENGRLAARLQARGHRVLAHDPEYRRSGEVPRVEIRAGETATLEIRIR